MKIRYYVPYEVEFDGEHENRKKLFTDIDLAIKFAADRYSYVTYIMEDDKGDEIEGGYVNVNQKSSKYKELMPSWKVKPSKMNQ